MGGLFGRGGWNDGGLLGLGNGVGNDGPGGPETVGPK